MALEGTLSYLDISHLLQVVGRSRKSGVLCINWEAREARLYFERGDLVRAESNRFHEGIGSFLVNSRVLAPEDLDRALALQQSEGGCRRLGAILCDEFDVRPEDIERLLRRQFELIVFDVFSWPGGTFVFEFEEPGASADRFRLDAVDFILAVGIQAGFLAEEGLELQHSDPERPHLIFLEDDPELLARYHDHWRRKGYRVTSFSRVEEVLACLATWDGSLRSPVVVANLVCPASRDRGLLGGLEVLKTARELHPYVRSVILAESSDARARIVARTAGADAFVRKPRPDDLRGAQGEVYFEVYMISLEHALELLTRAPAAPSVE